MYIKVHSSNIFKILTSEVYSKKEKSEQKFNFFRSLPMFNNINNKVSKKSISFLFSLFIQSSLQITKIFRV